MVLASVPGGASHQWGTEREILMTEYRSPDKLRGGDSWLARLLRRTATVFVSTMRVVLYLVATSAVLVIAVLFLKWAYLMLCAWWPKVGEWVL